MITIFVFIWRLVEKLRVIQFGQLLWGSVTSTFPEVVYASLFGVIERSSISYDPGTRIWTAQWGLRSQTVQSLLFLEWVEATFPIAIRSAICLHQFNRENVFFFFLEGGGLEIKNLVAHRWLEVFYSLLMLPLCKNPFWCTPLPSYWIWWPKWYTFLLQFLPPPRKTPMLLYCTLFPEKLFYVRLSFEE